MVQFYPWFKFSFLLFLGMVMYDNNMIMSLKQKERKFEPRIKLNHNIYIICVRFNDATPVDRSKVAVKTIGIEMRKIEFFNLLNLEMWKSVMVMFCYSGGSVEIVTFVFNVLIYFKNAGSVEICQLQCVNLLAC